MRRNIHRGGEMKMTSHGTKHDIINAIGRQMQWGQIYIHRKPITENK